MALSLSKNILKFLVVGILFTLIIFACRRNDLDAYNPILTAANERDLGNQLFQGILDDPSSYNYLDKTEYTELYAYLGAALRLVETQTEIRDFFDWDILVLDDVSQNIFTLPGGKFVITSGLLKYLDGEYQLVPLLGHEAYYIDRDNDGSPTSLSHTMQKMKDSFINSRGLGTKIFIDIIEGSDDMVSEIITEGRNISYDPVFVFEADAFATNLICDNYLYIPTGLRDILEKTEQDNNVGFSWLNNKPPSLIYSKPPEFTYESRIEQLSLLELPCIDNEFLSSSEFQEAISMLP